MNLSDPTQTNVSPWNRFAVAFNELDLWVLIFILLFLNTFSLKLGSNEEEYFVFAKAFANPNWLPGAHSVKDLPGGRIIFDSVIGYLLRFASFEQVAEYGRTLVALLFALPLAKLFRKLKFSNLECLFVLQIICCLVHQSFFAYEWIFGGFETKAISYVFVFYSLYHLLENQTLRGVIFAGFAIYFHILVGGWYALVMFFYLLVLRTPLKKLCLYSLAISAFTAPLVVYLVKYHFLNNPEIINGVRVSKIYVYLCNPQHLDMWGSIGRWGSTTQIGVALSLLSLALCFYLYRRNPDLNIKRLSLLNICLFVQQAVSLFIAAFDANGNFLKFYPYRTSSLSFFLMLLLLVMLYKEIESGKSHRANQLAKVKLFPASYPFPVVMLMFVVIVLGLSFKVWSNGRDSYQVIYPSSREIDRLDLYRWVREHTPKDSVFLEPAPGKRGNLDFIRKTERDLFSVDKFVPTTNPLIYEWYVRTLENIEVKKNISYVHELRDRYRIDYVVNKTPLNDPGIKLEFRSGSEYLYSLHSPVSLPASPPFE